MEAIRPVSDLQTSLEEISADAHESGRPIFLTREGRGDMVVLSLEAYQSMRFDSEAYAKLLEAEAQAEGTDERLSSDDVLAAVERAIADRLPVGNYAIFYWVEEDPEPVVTVARVLYKRRDVGTLLP